MNSHNSPLSGRVSILRGKNRLAFKFPVPGSYFPKVQVYLLFRFGRTICILLIRLIQIKAPAYPCPALPVYLKSYTFPKKLSYSILALP
jgi:hypothetical protein